MRARKYGLPRMDTLDLQNWPHLPLPRVRTTAAADYMALLSPSVRSTVEMAR